MLNRTDPSSTEFPQGDAGLPETEGRFHAYVSSRIPWYVRLLWIGFWVFAIYYVLNYFIPELKSNLPSSP
ncbi:MAG: hypothetical protein IT425_13580 [Pirellulales bacterium]|nr:hypothetical protein [Pirellulales bacterium]